MNPEGELAWILGVVSALIFELVQFRRGGTTLTKVLQKWVLSHRPGTYALAGLIGWLVYHFFLDLGDVSRVDAIVAAVSALFLGETGYRVRRRLAGCSRCNGTGWESWIRKKDGHWTWPDDAILRRRSEPEDWGHPKGFTVGYCPVCPACEAGQRILASHPPEER